MCGHTVGAIVERKGNDIFIASKSREIKRPIALLPSTTVDEENNWSSIRGPGRRRCESIHVETILIFFGCIVEEVLE